MNAEIAELYGGRLRIRVCGLLFDDEHLLLANHRGLNDGDFWSPPGGGVEFGEPMAVALQREFMEETGLNITVHQFAFGCELLRGPLHAIELFFWTEKTGGKLSTGYDPEFQIIEQTKLFSANDLQSMQKNELHDIFQLAKTKRDFQQLTGFYRI
ncbi:MAG: NUDIX hydrolase [Chryseolinea sp.]